MIVSHPMAHPHRFRDPPSSTHKINCRPNPLNIIKSLMSVEHPSAEAVYKCIGMSALKEI